MSSKQRTHLLRRRRAARAMAHRARNTPRYPILKRARVADPIRPPIAIAHRAHSAHRTHRAHSHSNLVGVDEHTITTPAALLGDVIVAFLLFQLLFPTEALLHRAVRCGRRGLGCRRGARQAKVAIPHEGELQKLLLFSSSVSFLLLHIIVVVFTFLFVISTTTSLELFLSLSNPMFLFFHHQRPKVTLRVIKEVFVHAHPDRAPPPLTPVVDNHRRDLSPLPDPRAVAHQKPRTMPARQELGVALTGVDDRFELRVRQHRGGRREEPRGEVWEVRRIGWRDCFQREGLGEARRVRRECMTLVAGAVLEARDVDFRGDVWCIQLCILRRRGVHVLIIR